MKWPPGIYYSARSWHYFFTQKILYPCPTCGKRRPIKDRSDPIFGTGGKGFLGIGRGSCWHHRACVWTPEVKAAIRKWKDDQTEAYDRGEIPMRHALRDENGKLIRGISPPMYKTLGPVVVYTETPPDQPKE